MLLKKHEDGFVESVVVVDDKVAVGVDIVIVVVTFVAAVLSLSSKSKSNLDLVLVGPVVRAEEASTAELCHWRGLYEAILFTSHFLEA